MAEARKRKEPATKFEADNSSGAASSAHAPAAAIKAAAAPPAAAAAAASSAKKSKLSGAAASSASGAAAAAAAAAAVSSSSACARPVKPKAYLTVDVVEKKLADVVAMVADCSAMCAPPLSQASAAVKMEVDGEEKAERKEGPATPSKGKKEKKSGPVNLFRAFECMNNAKLLCRGVKESPAFHAGAIGESGSGRSQMGRNLLTSQLTNAAAYESTDVNQSRTLNAQEKNSARDLYPTPSSHLYKHCTERPMIFGRAAKIRVTRVTCTKRVLQDRLHKVRKEVAKKAPALAEAIKQLDFSESGIVPLAGAVLYESQHANIWDDFKAASEVLAREEETHAWSQQNMVSYSSWSYTLYEGPWDGLKENMFWIDFPGFNDPDGDSRHMRNVIAHEVAKDKLQLIFLVLKKGKRPAATDIQILEPFINCSLKQLPLVLYVNVPGLQPTDTWKRQLEGKGVDQFYSLVQAKEHDRELSIPTFLTDALSKAAVDISICPSLDGSHRDFVFAQLIEMQKLEGQFTAVLFYTPDQQKDLERSGQWNGTNAGVSAMWSRIHMSAKYMLHMRLQDVYVHLRCALVNVHEYLLRGSYLKRAGVHPPRAKGVSKALKSLKHFGKAGWEFEEDEVPLLTWAGEDEYEDFRSELRRIIIDAVRTFNSATQADKLVAHLSTQLRHMLVLPTSKAPLAEIAHRLRQIITPMMTRRTRRACLESWCAVRLMLSTDPTKAITEPRMQKMFKQLDTVSFETRMALYDDAAKHVNEAGAAPSSDEPAMKGFRSKNLPPNLQEAIEEESVFAVFQRCKEASGEFVNELASSAWAQDKFCKSLRKSWKEDFDLSDEMNEDMTPEAVEDLLNSVEAFANSAARKAVLAIKRARGASGNDLIWHVNVRAKPKTFFRTQYEEVLELSASHAPENEVARLKSRGKSLLEGLTDVSPITPSNILESAHATFLSSEKVNLLSRERNAYESHGALKKLPVAVPEGDTPHPGHFRLASVPVQPFPPVVPAHASPRFRALLTDAWSTSHAKRIIMQFKKDDPSTRTLEIFAHSDWEKDLVSCLKATTRSSKRGISPVFIPSCGRSTNQMLAHLRELGQGRGLELAEHPETCVYVMVEPDEARSYMEKFADCPFITFVVLPASNRGIRWARACILYLAQCLREVVRKTIDFSYFHQLDDDWQAPRVFDPTTFSTTCMQPSTLFVVLAFTEKVLRAEVTQTDCRRLINFQNREQLVASHPAMAKLIDNTIACLALKNVFQVQQFCSLLTGHQNITNLMNAADRGLLDDAMAEVTSALPDFSDAFLKLFAVMRFDSVTVCQCSVTQKGITERHNYNLHKMPAVEESQGLSDEHFHYRISMDRVGCTCHFLQAYIQAEVNYVETDELFITNAEVEKFRKSIPEWFALDKNFAEEVLALRGIGGMLAFKVDIAYDCTKTKGGTAKFAIRVEVGSPKAKAAPKPRKKLIAAAAAAVKKSPLKLKAAAAASASASASASTPSRARAASRQPARSYAESSTESDSSDSEEDFVSDSASESESEDDQDGDEEGDEGEVDDGSSKHSMEE